jgi:hypothetical protein
MKKNKEMEEKWLSWRKKEYDLMMNGLEKKTIRLYNEEEIVKAREIYFEGLPASIILLSTYLCNGRCYDISFLVARLFLDDEDTIDLKLLYADVDSLRLNPNYVNENNLEHCVLYRKTKDGKRLIYDTSVGYIFNSEEWAKLESPTNISCHDKDVIIKALDKYMKDYPEKVSYIPEAALLLIPEVEEHYNDLDEQYAWKVFEYLPREVELFKNKINYNKLKEEYKDKLKELKNE